MSIIFHIVHKWYLCNISVFLVWHVFILLTTIPAVRWPIIRTSPWQQRLSFSSLPLYISLWACDLNLTHPILLHVSCRKLKSTIVHTSGSTLNRHEKPLQTPHNLWSTFERNITKVTALILYNTSKVISINFLSFYIITVFVYNSYDV